VRFACFLLFWCFKKATQEIFSELDETKAEVPIFSDTRRSPKQRRRGGRGQPHHMVARCNDPEKSPILELLVLFLFGIMAMLRIIMHISHFMFLLNLKLFGTKSLFILLVWFYNKPSLHSSYLD
jgi:hypothetical protein